MKLLQLAKPNRRQWIKPVIAQTATGAEQWEISLMEALVSRSEGSQMIHSLLSSPPGKFLELGVDALLTNRCFRGGNHLPRRPSACRIIS